MNCPIIKKEIYAKLKLKFRGSYKEIIFSSENSKCSFDVALTLINNNIDNKVDINEIKQILIKKYEELLIYISEF